MSAPRGYVTALFGCIGLTLLAAVILNTTVNPWRVTPTPWSAEKLDPYRDISSQIRTGKAGIVRSNESIGAAFIGSSRVANALDPEFAGWNRDDVVNLGCSGGFFYESEAILRYLIGEREVELVLFGIDPGDLSSDVDTRPMGDFYSSPLAALEDPLNRELRYLVGISTLEASFATLKRAAAEETTQYTPKGLRARPKKKGQKSQLFFIRDRIVGEAAYDLPDKGRTGNDLNAEKTQLLEGIMRACREKGIRFITFIHPTHALMHARAADASAPPALFESERRAVLDIATRVNAETSQGPPIEVWDFCDYHELNCEPIPRTEKARMTHWNDLGHYSIEMGNLIQSRVMGWPSPLEGGDSYGTRITPENFEQHLERVKKGYAGYLTGPRRDDVEWKEDLIRQAAAEP